jgi:hypothetical protein
MKTIKPLILIFLLSLILFHPQKVEAGIRVGKEYSYTWTIKSDFTYEGETLYTLKISHYSFEILYIDEDKIGLMQESAGGLNFAEYTLVSKEHPSYYYPDKYGSSYFLDSDDFDVFYEHWIEECSDLLYVTDFSAEKRTFSYSETNPDDTFDIGHNDTASEPHEYIYDTGEYTRSLECKYTRDGVLDQLVTVVSKIGEISEYHYREELVLTDVRAGSNLSIILIGCSILLVSLISVYIRKRRMKTC